MSSYARDIEAGDYPYIAYGLPGSPTPTINSSSAVASLIHYSGLDPTQTLPFGMRLSPGTSTLLGTGADDHMRVEHGFTTLLGGRGDDVFVGSGSAGTEKFYGGEGNDIFRWSPGFNIVHGGQPQLAYTGDGTDVMDYSGAGEVEITFNRHWVPHKTPNYVAVYGTGTDHLYSVERIQWNARPTTSGSARASTCSRTTACCSPTPRAMQAISAVRRCLPTIPPTSAMYPRPRTPTTASSARTQTS